MRDYKVSASSGIYGTQKQCVRETYCFHRQEFNLEMAMPSDSTLLKNSDMLSFYQIISVSHSKTSQSLM